VAQLPVADDLGVFDIPEKIHQERVLCRDLAAYLGCGVVTVQKWAKERSVLHKMPRRMRTGASGIGYVTPFIAARIIVYVRAKQEADREKKRRENTRYYAASRAANR
jgi:xanthine dehydrogenase iron-sulfur cluster and FAD-binding subunit A